MPRKVGLELMANTRDRTFLMFSLSLSFFTSCFSTDNNLGNSLPPPRPSPAPRNYRPPLLQPAYTRTRTRGHGHTLTLYPSILSLSLSASAHARMDASEAVLAAKHGPASVCPFTDARRSLAALCDRIFRAASVLCPSE